MIHSVRREAGKLPPPPQFTTADVQAGAEIYDANCAACHGAPGMARAPWTGGMTPTPPFLLDAAHQFTPNELYWIVRHGVKMTGMPAWEQTLSQREVWNVVAFLTALPNMSADAYLRARSTGHRLEPGRPPAKGG
jgi:mono/diheme cytochrome c family protein